MADEKDILFTATSSKTTVSKKSRSYGSTSRCLTASTVQKIQMHKVKPTDTLVSLAIKYETTVEELKRLNTLWSNESLQLKTNIKVPLTAAGLLSPGASAAVGSGFLKQESPLGNETLSLEQFVSEGEEPAGSRIQGASATAAAGTDSQQHQSAPAKHGKSIARSKTFSNDKDLSEMNSNEYLRKFDLQFMQLKSNIEKLENESSLSEEDSAAAYSCLPRRTARYMSRQAFRSADQTLEGGPPDSLANPELVVRSAQLPESEETFYKL